MDIRVKWMGSSCFELNLDEIRIVINPYYSRLKNCTPKRIVNEETLRNYQVDYILLSSPYIENMEDGLSLLNNPQALLYLPSRLKAEFFKQLPDKKRKKAIFPLEQHTISNEKFNLFSFPILPEPYNIRTISTTIARGIQSDEIRWRSILALLKRFMPIFFNDSLSLYIKVKSPNPFHRSRAYTTFFFFSELTNEVVCFNPKVYEVDFLMLPVFPVENYSFSLIMQLVDLIKPHSVIFHRFDNWMPPLTEDHEIFSLYDRIKNDLRGVPIVFPGYGKEYQIEELLLEGKKKVFIPPYTVDPF